jgi:type IV pilus assembly protein PilA
MSADMMPARDPGPRAAPSGFTLIELMAVVAVIAILAMIAIPGVQDRLVREQIVEVSRWADFAKTPIAVAWLVAPHAMPIDNAAAGLPAADKVVSNYVKTVTVEDGAVQIVFGNRAMSALAGKTLSLRPAVVPDAPMVPVAWVCGSAPVPGNMSPYGIDRTDIEKRFLPVNCK